MNASAVAMPWPWGRWTATVIASAMCCAALRCILRLIALHLWVPTHRHTTPHTLSVGNIAHDGHRFALIAGRRLVSIRHLAGAYYEVFLSLAVSPNWRFSGDNIRTNCRVFHRKEAPLRSCCFPPYLLLPSLPLPHPLCVCFSPFPRSFAPISTNTSRRAPGPASRPRAIASTLSSLTYPYPYSYSHTVLPPSPYFLIICLAVRVTNDISVPIVISIASLLTSIPGTGSPSQASNVHHPAGFRRRRPL